MGAKPGESHGVNGGRLQSALARGDRYYLATCKRHGASVFSARKVKGISFGHGAECYACHRERNWRWQGFALTWAGFVELLLKQLGRCAICGRTEDNLDVDHCHAGGHVRGLLCNTCNRGVGYLQNDPTLLRKAATYVEENK